MKHSFALLILGLAVAASASKLTAKRTGPKNRIGAKDCDGPNGCCKKGQGDCDYDSDCCNGLKCNYDWGFKTDYCVAGPTTKDYSWEDWSKWTKCTVSCGGTGTRTRSRNCIGPVDGGDECPSASETQTESCDAPACWTDFGDWSQCSLSCGGTGTQTRSKTCIEPENGGQPCPAQKTQEETKSCDVPACWTDFGDWSKCSLSCGGTGTQIRSKSCIEPKNGGIPCPEQKIEEESQSCDVPACWTDFGDWSQCSLSCGGIGTKKRSKSCIEPKNGGIPCPEQCTEEDIQNCDAPACWTDFGDWSQCSLSCGGTGTQTRSKFCIEPLNHGGLPCPEQNTMKESQSCDAPACWTNYTQWSSCQGICGQTGKQTRSRTCIEPETGGLPCPAESTETQKQDCDTNGLWIQ